jgi:hypothetical protein
MVRKKKSNQFVFYAVIVVIIIIAALMVAFFYQPGTVTPKFTLMESERCPDEEADAIVCVGGIYYINGKRTVVTEANRCEVAEGVAIPNSVDECTKKHGAGYRCYPFSPPSCIVKKVDDTITVKDPKSGKEIKCCQAWVECKCLEGPVAPTSSSVGN